jgi:DNA-binding response OmpR family regulator
MAKRVLDVGNCEPDHASIRDLIQRHFDAEVVQAHGMDDTLEVLRSCDVDLVLVNRLLDQDHSEGLDVIRRIKSERQAARVPVMMVTNFPEYQEQAVSEGAVEGFGKLQLHDERTVTVLTQYLG